MIKLKLKDGSVREIEKGNACKRDNQGYRHGTLQGCLLCKAGR